MDDAITVHPDVLRDCADGLAGAGYRLAYGLQGTPGLAPPAPGWVATAALAALQSAVDRYFGTVAGQGG